MQMPTMLDKIIFCVLCVLMFAAFYFLRWRPLWLIGLNHRTKERLRNAGTEVLTREDVEKMLDRFDSGIVEARAKLLMDAFTELVMESFDDSHEAVNDILIEEGFDPDEVADYIRKLAEDCAKEA